MQVTKAFRLVLALVLIWSPRWPMLVHCSNHYQPKSNPQPVVATPLKEEIKDRVMDIVASREELSLTVGYDDPENVLLGAFAMHARMGKKAPMNHRRSPLGEHCIDSGRRPV